MEPVDVAAPREAARAHLGRLVARLPAGAVPTETVDGIAATLERWPPWPIAGLRELIGPPGTTLRAVDLAWLHRFEATVRLLGWISGRLGGPAGGPTATSLLVERAPTLGHRGWGSVSAGGSCRLVATRDELVAVNLAREDDIDAVPAWLEVDVGHDLWTSVEAACRDRSAATLVDRAQLLGMPVARVGETDAATVRDVVGPPVEVRRPPLVVDLSALWAGPLCGWYLGRTGADVVKIEAERRPDGGRQHGAQFYRRLNTDKIIRDLDFDTAEGRDELRRLIHTADIVIEASRPRALEALGIDAAAEVTRGAIWVSITAHGRAAAPHRVGFGDDAAAAAGLLAHVGDARWFIGDAVADPITGATAATLAMGHWLGGRAALLDVPLAQSTALHVAGAPPHATVW